MTVAAGVSGCGNAKSEFESKCKKIKLDMSEQKADQILVGYPCGKRELFGEEKENPGLGKPLLRKGSFVKTYFCKYSPDAEDVFIHVYFDDNSTVVGWVMGEGK
jgi:hypothetical protein